MKPGTLATTARQPITLLMGLALALALCLGTGLVAGAAHATAPAAKHDTHAKPVKTKTTKTTRSNARTTAIPAPDLAVDPALDPAEYANRVMAAINAERLRAGLAPIAQYDACLNRISLGWAQRLTGSATLYHRDQRSVLKKCRLSWAGENLLRGVGVSPEDSVVAWMNSPAHRDIILTERATLAGVSFRLDPTGRLVGVLNLGDD